MTHQNTDWLVVHGAVFVLLIAGLTGACDASDPSVSDDGLRAAPPTATKPIEPDAAAPISPTVGEINGGCAPDGVSGHQTKKCAEDVIFDIDIPPRCLTSACGIILDVHGWSMNGPMQELHTRLAELTRTRDRPYIVIHPTGPGSTPSWGKGKNPFSRDFAFDGIVWGFFEATATRFHADERRLHVTGFSQGAMMSFRLAFEHFDRLASIAPVAGPEGFATPTPFSSAKPTGIAPLKRIPILYIHGTLDRELKFDVNASVVRDEIVKAYGLLGPEAIAQDAPTVRASRYRENGNNVLFEFWEHDYSTDDGLAVGGHCLPGPVEKGDGTIFARPASVKPFRCTDKDQAFDAGVYILRFFEEHPKG